MTCERVVIIDRGSIVAEDTAEALTRRVEGSDRSLVRVEGPTDAVRALLAAVPGVERVEPADAAVGASASGASADGVCGFVAHSRSGEPVRKAIAAAVVGRGWGLIEVRPLALSLEDLFVRLVTEEKAGAPP
jgi:ABC-2 type transport system ATP-binding protein